MEKRGGWWAVGYYASLVHPAAIRPMMDRIRRDDRLEDLVQEV